MATLPKAFTTYRDSLAQAAIAVISHQGFPSTSHGGWPSAITPLDQVKENACRLHLAAVG
jgi:hypothetical protein